MKKLSLGLMFLLLLTFISCDKESDNNPDPIVEDEITNEEKATELLLSLPAGVTSKAIMYIDANQFIQHNHRYANGRDALVKAISNGDFSNNQINIVRTITDGDQVAFHSEYMVDGAAQIVFDVFRFENGNIVEHWDNWQRNQLKNESGWSMIDGANTISNLDETDNNRTIVDDFISRVMVLGNYELMSEFLKADLHYIQHNPMMTDSLTGMLNMMDTLANQGFAFSYETLHKTIAMGNFVLTISEGQYGDPAAPAAFYDLFRLEEGKLVEHWDVIETIAPENEWQNQNGKF